MSKLVLLSCDSNLQGVRPSQEDRHLCLHDLEAQVTQSLESKDTATGETAHLSADHSATRGGYRALHDTGRHSLFSIFDGHNGTSASEFCRVHMPIYLAEHMSKDGSVSEDSIQKSFVECDRDFLRVCQKAPILTMDGEEQPKQMHPGNFDDDDSDDSSDEDDGPPAFDVGYDRNGGCTAVVAVLDNQTRELTVAHTGDARCVVARDNKAICLSKHDHKPTLGTEHDRIIQSGHYVLNGRLDGCLMVSRAIGDLQFKGKAYLDLETYRKSPPEPRYPVPWSGKIHSQRYAVDLEGAKRMPLCAVPDVAKHQLVLKDPDAIDEDGKNSELTAGDQFMILACDGLFEAFTNQEAVDWVLNRVGELHKLQSRRSRRRGPAIQGPMTAATMLEVIERVYSEDPIFNIASELAEAAIQKGSKDNVSCIIVFFASLSTELQGLDESASRSRADRSSLDFDSFAPYEAPAPAMSEPNGTSSDGQEDEFKQQSTGPRRDSEALRAVAQVLFNH